MEIRRVAALRREKNMVTFLIVFAVLTVLAVNAIRTTREIDRMEDAEWEAVEDHHKMDMRRDDTEDGE